MGLTGVGTRDRKCISTSMLDRAADLTAVDLFSGAGGLTLGLKQAGFRVLAGVELENIPASTYKKTILM